MGRAQIRCRLAMLPAPRALLCGLFVLALWGSAEGQQSPGMPYPLQLFHLAPSAASLLPHHQHHQQEQLRQQQPGTKAPSHRMLPPAAVRQQQDVDDDSDASDVGRFQVSDGAGRAIFGYLLPDQTRVEQRSPDGTVHGAYSYLDKDGQTVKVQYWDAGGGFHAATNHLPAAALGLPLPPLDTPEVQAARDQHLRKVQQALLQHALALDRLEALKQRPLQHQQHQPSQHQPPQHQPAHQTPPHQPPQHQPSQHQPSQLRPPQHQPAHQTPPHQPPQHQPSQHRPPLPFVPPLHKPQLPSQQVVSDGDSLVVESDGHQEDEPLADEGEGELTRYPDLQQVAQALYDPSHVHDPDLEAVIVDADAPGPAYRTRGKARALTKPEEKAEKKAQESEKDISKAAANLNNYYMFWHTVPMYVEVKTIQDEPEGKSKPLEPQPLSLSQKAAFANAMLPSAVHSFQVPPSRSDLVLPQLPIFLSPQETLPLSYSAKAAYFHSIPVAAVHDAQVHPQQRGSFVDHQIQPVFHLTPSEN